MTTYEVLLNEAQALLNERQAAERERQAAKERAAKERSESVWAWLHAHLPEELVANACFTFGRRHQSAWGFEADVEIRAAGLAPIHFVLINEAEGAPWVLRVRSRHMNPDGYRVYTNYELFRDEDDEVSVESWGPPMIATTLPEALSYALEYAEAYRKVAEQVAEQVAE